MLVDFLDHQHSRELFKLHCGSIPQGVTENMVDAILSKCAGLPLSLKARSACSAMLRALSSAWEIQCSCGLLRSGRGPLQVVGAMLGGAVAGREVATWSETARKLEEAGEFCYDGENLFKQLRISIDSLDAHVREMFLDVACIMLGWKRADVMAHWAGWVSWVACSQFLLHRPWLPSKHMWAVCLLVLRQPEMGCYPITGLDILQKRCLLTFRSEPEGCCQTFVTYEETWHGSSSTSGLPEHISMHDQLRDLGRAIEKTNMGGALDWAARKRVWEESEYSRIKQVRSHAGGACSQGMFCSAVLVQVELITS